jgi:hypothetical protein
MSHGRKAASAATALQAAFGGGIFITAVISGGFGSARTPTAPPVRMTRVNPAT